MAIVSLRTRRRTTEISLTIMIIVAAWFLQQLVLNRIELKEVMCGLPLTITIVWGALFGSLIPTLTPEEVRTTSLSDVVVFQALSGSISGALVGGAFGALYASLLPVFPVCYPLIGWIAGYFCLKSFSQAPLLVIPLVFLATVLAETIMACQLTIAHRPDVFLNLTQVALPEAAINSLIAPLVLFPLKGWYEFSKEQAARAEE
jgi:rod shape-determining protein MreD